MRGEIKTRDNFPKGEPRMACGCVKKKAVTKKKTVKKKAVTKKKKK
ncbi:MAG: hypothetical protein LBR59_01245 [Endomicrobium sp.]|nr:hypothetical protein [Endomicrobium sp.]